MKKAISKNRRSFGSRFAGTICSRLSVRGATNACHSASAPRFAQRSGDSAFFLSAILWTLVASSAFAQTNADFTKANQQYAQGHFKEAISSYEALIHAGQLSATLFYDLGNAYFRTGDFGRAILNYERALALERHHPEAAANLQIARDEARALELQQSLPERYLQFATVNQYSVAAATAFWGAVFAIVILLFARRRSVTLITALIFCLLIGAFSTYAVYTLERGTNGSAMAIVTGKDVQARLATADTANSVLALPPGSEVKILSTRGDWIYAALPNNLRGWIPAKNAQQVRL
jgi:tetratricopeptide (TPR) repeat protein